MELNPLKSRGTFHPSGYRRVSYQSAPTTHEVVAQADDVVELGGSNSRASKALHTLRSRASATAPEFQWKHIAGVLFVWNLFLTIGVFALLNSQHNLAANSANSWSKKKSDTFNADCSDSNYLRNALKTQYEDNIGGLLTARHGTRVYEASGVAFDRKRDVFWVIFDSLSAIGRFPRDLRRGGHNLLVPSFEEGFDANSQFEGISFDEFNDRLYLTKEGLDVKGDGTYQATIQRVDLSELDGNANTGYTVLHECVADFDFTGENKGLEALRKVPIFADDDLLNPTDPLKWILLGLCEGNHCKGGKKGKDKGNGRLVVFDSKRTINNSTYEEFGYDCHYEQIDQVKIPESAYFQDYSAFSLKHVQGNNWRMVLVSQEDSSIWLSDFNAETLEFSGEPTLKSFMRDSSCKVEYCNVEGIDFIDDHTFVAVSDETKKKGKQEFQCRWKDQSIHLFQMQYD